MSVGAGPVLVFDGDCGFCTTCARWVEERFQVGTARVIAWQSLGAEGCSALGVETDQLRASVWWVERGSIGCRWAGHRAVGHALMATTNPGLRMLGRTILVPPFSWMAAAVYPLVARFRHRLPGGTPACRDG